MSFIEKNKIRIAILDLYEGFANQGMRCIREILNQFGETNNMDVSWDEFDVRQKNEVPDLSYDIFISSGGPGSPLDSKGSEWEKVYFNWLHKVEKWTTAKPMCKKNMYFLYVILFSSPAGIIILAPYAKEKVLHSASFLFTY